MRAALQHLVFEGAFKQREEETPRLSGAPLLCAPCCTAVSQPSKDKGLPGEGEQDVHRGRNSWKRGT